MASKQSKPNSPPEEPKESKEPKLAEDEPIDFDSNWKFLIIKYFFQFIAFFIPDLYKDIDTERPPVFLDNELHAIWRAMKTGLKMTDKLVQVWLKNGEERLLLVHIEVQARFETLFSKRMFTISYRILDRFGEHPVELAVFVDTPIPSQFDTYEYIRYGTETRHKYNAYRIIDQIESELLKRDDNLFALVVLANLRTIQTKGKEEEKKEKLEFDRLTFKKHLYNLLVERNFEPEVYYDVLNFIDYMMILPESLKIEYENFTTKTTKKSKDMLKLKPGPGMKGTADAIYLGAYGVDVATEREAAKRKVQVANRKAKEADVKAKEAIAKVAKLVLALRFDRTAEQIAAMADISLKEVNAILNAHPLGSN
jgi:hypothetical protein